MSEQQKPEQLYAPWEKTFNKIATPFEEFIHQEATSGLLLMICALSGLIIANSFFATTYQHILHTPIGFSIGGWQLEKTLHHWVNDGLMALFFFVVGLEIKREILVGELAEPRHAALPVIAAIGGMVTPALIYAGLNLGGDGIMGWGIPMATDIAFAVGVLVLLGNRIPRTLLTFLVALAIVDDLGGVLVIALFYTEQIHYGALGLAVLLLLVLIVCNLVGFRKPIVYFILGLLLWLAMLKSGIHATLAGVLTALTIPARAKFEPLRFSQHVRNLMDRFDADYEPNHSIVQNIMQHETQKSILQTLKNGVDMVETPLQRLEHRLHMPVAFVIIPLFALTNAGIPIHFDELVGLLSHPVTLGVMFGLVVGKVVGIAGFSWLAVRLGVCTLPSGTHMSQIVGVSLIGGIGFTMSIFIAELAFGGHPEYLLMAKTGILMASLVAGLGGYLWLVREERGSD